MEKFGIFKLLNSFFDFYAKNAAKATKNDGFGGADGSGLGDALSSLFKNKSFSEFDKRKETSTKPVNAAINPRQETPKPPLQNSMLAVMKTHDQTVKRILNKNKDR